METNNLAAALAKAQSEMGPAPKNGYNPHFRSHFSTFEDLKEVSHKVLAKHGLSITQYPDFLEGVTFLVTKLKHISGQEEVSRTPLYLKDQTDIQKFGSAISYAKRYVYASICGIATSEGDDDGNSNGHNSAADKLSTPRPSQMDSQETLSSEFVSPKQLALLRARIQNNTDLEKAICSKYSIPSLEKLPWRNMNELLGVLQKQA